MKGKLLILLIFFLVVWLYRPTLNAYFVSDDYEWWRLVRNLNFFDSLRLFLPSIWGGIVHPQFQYYRPLVAWTIWFNTVILPMTPLAFHLTNLAIHLANIGLVIIIGSLIFGSSQAAILSGILFAVFPYQREAVNYSVSGRYNLLMTSFYLLAVLFLFYFARSGKSRYLLFSGLAFFLSLLSLESAITFPLSVALILFTTGEKTLTLFKRYRFYFLVLSFIVLAYFLLRNLALRLVGPPLIPGYMADMKIAGVFKLYLVGLAVLAVGRFISELKRGKKIPWPLGQGRFIIRKKRSLLVLVGKSRLILLYLSIGIFILPTALIPTQERHLYLPSVGMALFAGGALAAWFSFVADKWLKVGLAVVIFLVLGGSSFFVYRRNQEWGEAAGIAREISVQLSGVVKRVKPGQGILVVNIPDNLNGVYIYRVHEKEAVEFISRTVPPKMIFTPKTIGIQSDAQLIDPTSLALTSSQGFFLFRPQKDEQEKLVIRVPEYTAIQKNANTLQISLNQENFDVGKDEIYVYKNGRLIPIQPKKND